MTLVVVLCWPGGAAGEDEHGPPPQRSTVPAEPRPDGAVLLACSAAEPVCLHASGPSPPADVARRVLVAAEQAAGAFRRFGMPAPRPDAGRGGSMAVDIYLDPGVHGSRAWGDPLEIGVGFDLTSAYALVSPQPRGPACALESDVARALAQIWLLGLDAATHDSVLAAQSSYLASQVAPCAALELAAIDRFQRTPERSWGEARPDGLVGELLLPWYLDIAYGTGHPGAVMNGLIATSCQRTPTEAYLFDDEPDVFDALREVLPPRGKELGDFLLDLAVARAFLGDRSDGALVPDSERFGALGRVRFEWAVGYDSLPRRLAPLRPVAATGSTYLYLELGAPTPGRGLLMVADWEENFVFQWTLVRLDASGRGLGRVTSPAVWGNTQAQLTLDDLADTGAVLVVGTLLGGDDRSHPYDPDDGAAREAAYTVTLHAR